MGTVIGSFIGGLLAIGAAVLIFKKLKTKGKPDVDPSEPVTEPPPPDPEAEMKALMGRLVQLNLRIRTTFGLTSEIIRMVEDVIDLLKNTVPQMIDRHPSETLTYELKRICKDHLPQVVSEFTDLSAESRQRHTPSFMASLSDVRDQIQRANEIVEHNEVAEFKVMASFLKTKYASGNM